MKPIIFKSYRYGRHIYLMTVLLLLPMLAGGCVSDAPADRTPGLVSFRASVRETDEVSTRAIPTVPVNNLTWGNEPFYFNMELTDGRQGNAVYHIKPGTEGQLYAPDSDNSLLWLDPYINHVFYAWTLPWTSEGFASGGPARTPVSFLEKTYQDLEFEKDEWFNCAILEKFIGAKTQPLNYNTNGEYVEVNFEHLVSKININKVQLVSEDGTSNENVTATITFYQMPQSAIFDRRPADGGAPQVVHDPDAAQGITCLIGQPTTLYVCPGIDFADMQFSIHFEDGNSLKGDYYGDFKSVLFNRNDTSLGNWDKGKSRTVLYAGEMMTLNLTLRGGQVPGVRVDIKDWNTRPSRPGTGYPKKGIYSSSELLDMYNKFSSDYSQEAVDEVFDIYGEEVNGKKVVHLYEDAVLGHTRMPMANELILDGTGHTVQITSISHTINGVNYPYVAHVCCCRNIFITDGEHIIYIDENYNIWLVDSETLEMRPSGNKLDPAPLEGTSYYSYYIDYETGATRATASH